QVESHVRPRSCVVSTAVHEKNGVARTSEVQGGQGAAVDGQADFFRFHTGHGGVRERSSQLYLLCRWRRCKSTEGFHQLSALGCGGSVGDGVGLGRSERGARPQGHAPARLCEVHPTCTHLALGSTHGAFQGPKTPRGPLPRSSRTPYDLGFYGAPSPTEYEPPAGDRGATLPAHAKVHRDGYHGPRDQRSGAGEGERCRLPVGLGGSPC